MRLVNRSRGAGIVIAVSLVATSASASARTIEVSPGDSVEGAVKRAHPGDVILVNPGVYRGSVEIKTSHLALRGTGQGPHGSVIKPRGGSRRCHGGGSGFCVLEHRNARGRRAPTTGTRISGFRVKGFHDSGAIAEGAKNTVLWGNSFIHNDEYGAAAFSSRNISFVRNIAKDAGEAGFYVGDSRHAEAVLRGNRATHNGEFGFFLRDSSHGLVIHNRATRNCLGIGLINTGARGGVNGWKVGGNKVLRNRRLCPGGDEAQAISGTGIALLGASGNRIKRNQVVGNVPRGSSAFAGGIVVFSSKLLGGTDASRNKIVRNRAFGNQPDDIVWDANGVDNEFEHNRCDTSLPGGLCG